VAIPSARPSPLETVADSASIEISGTVTYYHPSSRDREPIPEATVRLLVVPAERELASAVTDEEGRFMLSIAAPVDRPPFVLRVVPAKEGLLSWNGGWDLDVAKLPFRRLGVDLVLHRRGELRGLVLGASGDVPVPRAEVQVLKDSFEGGHHRLVPLRGASAIADEKGWFSIAKPAKGVYFDFQVSAVGHFPVVLKYRPYEPLPAGYVLVRLERVADFPRIEGSVRDGEGRAIEGARVHLEFPPGASLEIGEDGEPIEAIRDSRGTYSLQLWRRGRWEIGAVKDGLVETQTVDEVEARAYECDFTLAGTAVTLVGMVRARATHLPIARAVVCAPRTNWGWWLGRDCWNTDDSGRIRAGPVPRETVAFRVTAAGYAGRTVEVVPDRESDEFEFVVELDEEAKIRGRIVDRAGAGLPQAQVWVQERDSRLGGQATTDEAGAFEVRGFPLGVPLEVIVTLTGRDGSRLTSRIDLTLERPGEVRELGGIVLPPRE
jgi:uncharacterized GH25 family protein